MRSVFFFRGLEHPTVGKKTPHFLWRFFLAGFEGVGWNHLGYSAFQELLWDVIFGYFRCLAAWFHYSSESFTVLQKNKSKGFLQVHPFISLITLPETNEYPLKIGHLKRTFHLPTIHFQVRTVSFREGNHLLFPPQRNSLHPASIPNPPPPWKGLKPSPSAGMSGLTKGSLYDLPSRSLTAKAPEKWPGPKSGNSFQGRKCSTSGVS